MIEVGRRRYAHALQLLLTGITAPTMVLNAITVASMKKWILVSLLHAGEVRGLGTWQAEEMGGRAPPVPAMLLKQRHHRGCD